MGTNSGKKLELAPPKRVVLQRIFCVPSHVLSLPHPSIVVLLLLESGILPGQRPSQEARDEFPVQKCGVSHLPKILLSL